MIEAKSWDLRIFEQGIEAIRRGVGPHVLIHPFCCGPYFSYLGLVDRVRVGDDAHALGDFEALKAMARQLSANFMLHQRFWINDSDPVFVGGRNMVHNAGAGPLGGAQSDLVRKATVSLSTQPDSVSVLTRR